MTHPVEKSGAKDPSKDFTNVKSDSESTSSKDHAHKPDAKDLSKDFRNVKSDSESPSLKDQAHKPEAGHKAK